MRCPQLSDFKYTFLHSQLFMDEGHVDSAFSGNKIDAWKAAEIQRQVMERDNLAKMEAKDIMDQRKYLRGQLAGSQLMIERVKYDSVDYLLCSFVGDRTISSFKHSCCFSDPLILCIRN